MHTTISFDWVEHYPAAVSVCDTKGTIIAINKPAMVLFQKYGGATLVGTSLFDCHPKAANVIIRKMLKEQNSNTYITEKQGTRHLVHQTPWYHQGQFGGLTETIIPLPEQVAIKKRD